MRTTRPAPRRRAYLLANDEERRRLVVRAVRFLNADGIGDARLRRRTREDDRADVVHPADHELGSNSGSQATSLLIRALTLHELEIKDWWRVALREVPNGLVLGAMLGLVGIVRISLWQYLGFYDYGEHWTLIALTVGAALVGIVMFGSLTGSILPFILQGIGFDPASASAPFVATLVEVTGLVIYFSVASLILRGTLL